MMAQTVQIALSGLFGMFFFLIHNSFLVLLLTNMFVILFRFVQIVPLDNDEKGG